jgi:hypothetical protein
MQTGDPSGQKTSYPTSLFSLSDCRGHRWIWAAKRRIGRHGLINLWLLRLCRASSISPTLIDNADITSIVQRKPVPPRKLLGIHKRCLLFRLAERTIQIMGSPQEQAKQSHCAASRGEERTAAGGGAIQPSINTANQTIVCTLNTRADFNHRYPLSTMAARRQSPVTGRTSLITANKKNFSGPSLDPSEDRVCHTSAETSRNQGNTVARSKAY